MASSSFSMASPLSSPGPIVSSASGNILSGGSTTTEGNFGLGDEPGVVVICPFCLGEISIHQPSLQSSFHAPGAGRRRASSISQKRREEAADEGDLALQLSTVQLGLLSHLEVCLLEGESSLEVPLPPSLHLSLPNFTQALGSPIYKPIPKEEELHECELCEELVFFEQLRGHYFECLEACSLERFDERLPELVSLHPSIPAAKFPHPSRGNKVTTPVGDLPSLASAQSNSSSTLEGLSFSTLPATPEPSLSSPLFRPESTPRQSSSKVSGSGNSEKDKKLWRILRNKTDEPLELLPLTEAKDKQKVALLCLDNGNFLRPTKEGRVFADEAATSSTNHFYFTLRKKDDQKFYLGLDGKYLWKKKSLGIQADHLLVNAGKKTSKTLVLDRQAEVVALSIDSAPTSSSVPSSPSPIASTQPARLRLILS